MAKRISPSEPQKRPYKTTGLHLPTDLWELLNRLAFERSRTKGGRASASAIIVGLIERHRKELEKELASANR
jgi:predicted DNA-binding protein